MARNVEGLKLRPWGVNAATKTSPEDAGLDRADGWTDPYGQDRYPPLGVFNQVWLEITSLLYDIEQHGVLEWHANQAYAHPTYTVATNGDLYRSVQSSGGDNPSKNPIIDLNREYWRPALEAPTALAVVSANALEAGDNNAAYVTALRLLSLFKANLNARWQATADKYGLTRFGTKQQINSRHAGLAVNGQVLKSILDDMTVPNATTAVRGKARFGNATEQLAGLLSSVIATPAGVKAQVADRLVELGNLNIDIAARNTWKGTGITVPSNTYRLLLFDAVLPNRQDPMSVFREPRWRALTTSSAGSARTGANSLRDVNGTYFVGRTAANEILVATTGDTNDPMPLVVFGER